MTRLRLTILAAGALSQQWAPILGAWFLFEVLRMLWQLFTQGE